MKIAIARAICYVLLLFASKWAAESFWSSSNTAAPAFFVLGALVGETMFAARMKFGSSRSIAFWVCLLLLTAAGLFVTDRAVLSHNCSCERTANATP